MSDGKAIASTGHYLTEGIFLRHLSFQYPNEAPAQIEFVADLDTQDVRDGNLVAVIVSFRLYDGAAQGDTPYDLVVVFKAIFRIEGNPEPPLEKFVKLNALATVFPYIREAIHSITGRSETPAILLPLVNIHKLLGKGKHMGTLKALGQASFELRAPS